VVTEWTYGEVLLRAGDGVVEQFSRAISGSMRIPLVWLAAELETRKHEVVRVKLGTASDSDCPLFSDVIFTNPAFTFDLPVAEEAGLRSFLEAAARDGGRRI
jgi:hypothetical protein